MRDGSSRNDATKLRELIHQAPVGVFLMDEKGNELILNDQWCAITGLSRKDAKNMGWLRSVHPDDRARVEGEIQQSLKDRTGYSLEYRLQRPDGGIVWVISKAAPISDTPGQPEGYIVVMMDVVSQGEIEHQLVQTTQQLRDRLRFKFSELTSLTHELRTPLNSILGLSELLQDELEQAKHGMYIRMIYESSLRLTRTIDRILELSRPEPTESRSALRATDLVPLVQTATSRFADLAKSKGVDVNVILQKDRLAAFVDAAMLQEAMTYVLDNAFKFTHHGSVQVKLGERESGGRMYAEIVVHDTGIGIPEEFQASVFEPFFQVSNGPRRNYEGTGLGLTVAKKIVEEMNGTIAIQSAPDKGTRVAFCFPVVQFRQP